MFVTSSTLQTEQKDQILQENYQQLDKLKKKDYFVELRKNLAK